MKKPVPREPPASIETTAGTTRLTMSSSVAGAGAGASEVSGTPEAAGASEAGARRTGTPAARPGMEDAGDTGLARPGAASVVGVGAATVLSGAGGTRMTSTAAPATINTTVRRRTVRLLTIGV